MTVKYLLLKANGEPWPPDDFAIFFSESRIDAQHDRRTWSVPSIARERSRCESGSGRVGVVAHESE